MGKNPTAIKLRIKIPQKELNSFAADTRRCFGFRRMHQGKRCSEKFGIALFKGRPQTGTRVDVKGKIDQYLGQSRSCCGWELERRKVELVLNCDVFLGTLLGKRLEFRNRLFVAVFRKERGIGWIFHCKMGGKKYRLILSEHPVSVESVPLNPLEWNDAKNKLFPIFTHPSFEFSDAVKWKINANDSSGNVLPKHRANETAVQTVRRVVAQEEILVGTERQR